MRVAGIVCEYNPFHNGHLYHLKQAAASPDGEYIVCVQSSNFLQRGQPALLPKNLRAESAIKNGADLVFDLPFVFSCSSAEYYASAAVLMLGRLGIADSLVFGSESNNLPLLKKIADLLLDEPYDYKRILKDNLGKGFSFAKARALALGEYFNDSQTIELIEGSNNILAVEYLKAIKKFNLPITPVLVHRIGSAYKDEKIKNIHPSATAIRKSIISKGVSSVIDYIPTATYELLDAFYKDHTNYINIEMLRDAVFYRIASLSTSELRSYPGISEGFENRLKAALAKASGVSDLIDKCATKRYPRTRVARSLIYILIDFKKDDAYSVWSTGPLYARILASSKRGLKLLPVLERNAQIPVFTSLKAFYDHASPSIKKLLDYEVKASDIYSVTSGLPLGSEYTIKFNVFK